MLNTDYQTGTYVYEKDKTGTLCFTCHSDDMLKKDKPESTGFRDGKNNLHFLHVNRDKSRNCTVCHDVHGSDLPHLINVTASYGKWEFPLNYSQTETGGLCAPACHNLYAYSNKAKGEKIIKPAMPGENQSIKNGELNCEIVPNKGFSLSSIKNLKFHVGNEDNTYSKDFELNNSLVFNVKELPKGNYKITIDKNSLKLIKGTTDALEQTFAISGKPEPDIINIQFKIKIRNK